MGPRLQPGSFFTAIAARWMKPEVVSGMFVINPPWTLPGVLQETLPWLGQRLALDAGAGHSLSFELP